MTTATCTAFAGDRLIASGAPSMVVAAVKAAHDAGAAVLVFDDADARPVEFDLRGDLAAVLARLPSEPVEKRGPGRPKLGVTAREAEVLLWVSYGKTNKTISEILGISPRTVNKHLEQVFRKLGVETRAAATAIAVRYLAD